MPAKILMPALSPTMTHGNLARWLKKKGDKVAPGDLVAEIETDKATMELEAVDEGVIGKILVEEGAQNVAVGSVIAVLLLDGEDESAMKDADLAAASPQQQEQKKEEEKAEKPSESKPAEQPKSTGNDESRIFISPLARRIAKEKGIDITTLKGSGPSGRIVKRDVEGAGAAQASQMASEVPHSNMRRIIAARLLESKQNIPHFYATAECNLDDLLKMRAGINADLASKGQKIKISVNDFMIFAASRALALHPKIRGQWSADAIKYDSNIDISVAVSIEDGLITPIIKNADTKSLAEISAEMKNLAAAARAGKLMPHEFQGGGFSISNLGMYGTKSFSAIVNPPQSCIMAIGAGIKKPVVGANDQIMVSTMMEVTISCDHRVVDGALAAEFLADFKKLVESPYLMML